jgi:sodium/proline symporter
MNNIALISTFVLYFIAIFYIGYIAYRKTSNIADYLLGGRQLGRWTTALSAGASDMSGWLLLGLPGYAYVAGMEAIWIAASLLVGTYLNWLFVAPRLRVKSEQLDNALTLPEYLENRFNDNSHVLRLITAIFILVFFLFYTSSGLVAGGKLFESTFGLPYTWAVICGAITILAYTAIGGFLAVAWTDLLQGLLMALALAIVAIFVMGDLGGPSSVINQVNNTNPALTDMFSNASSEPLTIIGLISLLGWGLGYFGQPHILIRFMAIKNVSLIKDSRRIATTWTLFSLCAALVIGISGIVYLDTPLAGPDSETIFIVLVQLIFHPVIAGICLAAILAAIMSTADSQLLVSSSAVTEDIYKLLFRKQATDHELVMVSRLSVIVIGVIATLLALNPNSNVLDLVSYAWGGFGAAFGPVMLFSLFSENMNKYSAMAGVLVGAITVIVWKQLSGGIFELYELVPGFMLSCLCIVLINAASAHFPHAE